MGKSNTSYRLLSGALILLVLFSCTESTNVRVEPNKLPKYSGVSTIRIENYIQRMFIDLLGREATEFERTSFSLQLKNAALHDSCRHRLVKQLMFDTSFRVACTDHHDLHTVRPFHITVLRTKYE